MQNIENKIEEEVKDKVIDSAIFGMGGRLLVLKPEKDPYGADLVVEKKGDYKGGGKLRIKVSSVIGPLAAKKIAKDFYDNEVNASKDFYLMFVYFDRVSQKISEHAWLIPTIQFKEIALVAKASDGRKILKFEASLDAEREDKFSKFIINIKDLGDICFESLDSGKPVGFKKAIFVEERTVNLETLKEFISEARANTFAAANNPDDNPRLLGSEQQEFQKGEFFYRDIYFSGNKNFIGQEIVYLNSKPVWGMNYLGNQIGKQETSFLQSALLKLSAKCRFGENCEFEKREYKYEDFGQGNLDGFFGQEKIFVSNKEIYKLDYRGGLISDKI
jgi:hypothetical protein